MHYIGFHFFFGAEKTWLSSRVSVKINVMNKKNDKRLCWNCDGAVSLHLGQCPYCGVDLSQPQQQQEGEKTPFQGFVNPFQSQKDEGIFKPPYANAFNTDLSVSQEEWNQTLGEEVEAEKEQDEEELPATTRKEMVALLLLLPGIVFFLFALALLFFSSNGVLTLQWNQSFAYFYFFGAIPLLYLGWRALR